MATGRSLANDDVNQSKLRMAEASLRTMLADALKVDFYGTIGLEISIQGGVIQHIRERTERVVK